MMHFFSFSSWSIFSEEVSINIQNKYGNTALHEAAEKGHNEVAATLIKAGADLNIQNNEGKTAIQVAMLANHEKIARLE